MSLPRRICVQYTIGVMFEVPEDFPITDDELQKHIDWKANDYSDGRYSFTHEMMTDAARRHARNLVMGAIDHHYCERVERAFPPCPDWDHYTARQKLIERCANKVTHMGPGNGGEIDVQAKTYKAVVDCPGCGFEVPADWKSCTCGAKLK